MSSMNIYAGEKSLVYPLGFSEDNKYFAHAEVTTFDGSGFSTATVKIIDVIKNQYVSNTQYPNTTESLIELKPFDALQKVLSKSQKSLKKFKIQNFNFVEASMQVAKETPVKITKLYNISLSDVTPIFFQFQLSLESIQKAKGETPEYNEICGMEGMECQIFNLGAKSLLNEKSSLKTLQKDDSLPKSRLGAFSYNVSKVYYPLNRYYISENEVPLIVFIETSMPGFEGPSIRITTVSGTLTF